MKRKILFIVAFFLVQNFSWAKLEGMKGVESQELETVEFVDIDRYLGKWFEIASFPQRFQKGCTGTTAEYSKRDDGDIRVVNTCFVDSLSGRKKQIEGRAWVSDPKSNSKLKVRFFWPFSGKYWIIDLDKQNYSYALVGAPNRKYLWILSRTPKMDSDTFNKLVESAKSKGFDVSKLQQTLQE